MPSFAEYSLIDVDYGFCDECGEYEVVNTYSKPYTCACNSCIGRRLKSFNSICGKCLKEKLDANL